MNAINNEPRTFQEIRARLDQIVTEVRDKDLSLEKSLDLFEEAIRLGNRCSDLVDKAEYSDEELDELAALAAAADPERAAAADGTTTENGVLESVDKPLSEALSAVEDDARASDDEGDKTGKTGFSAEDTVFSKMTGSGN